MNLTRHGQKFILEYSVAVMTGNEHQFSATIGSANCVQHVGNKISCIHFNLDATLAGSDDGKVPTCPAVLDTFFRLSILRVWTGSLEVFRLTTCLFDPFQLLKTGQRGAG